MRDKYETSIKKLELILENKTINEYKKETILKLINIFNNTNSDKFENIIIKNLKNNTKGLDIFSSLINSILSDFEIKYDKKIILKNISIYEYSDNISIFLREAFDPSILMSEINKYNITEIQLHNLSTKKKKLIQLHNLINELNKINITNFKLKLLKS